MTATLLTPADLGILAAVLDDALASGLGDDSIVELLVAAIIREDMPATEPESTAYRFYWDSLVARWSI